MSDTAHLNTSHQTVAWFSAQSESGNLVIRPPFQRRPVWTQDAKSFFIDSVLRGLPVPEIYIQTTDVPDGDSDPKISIVDGQQRIRACLEFLAGTFAVSFDVEKLRPLYTLADTPWYGKRFADLSSEYKTQFRRYKLIVRDLEEADDQFLRHIFHRLNQSNVALNAQELRYSIYPGGLLDSVERLVKRAEWQHFRFFTTNQRRRMLDSEYISELVIGHLHWPQNKKDNLDSYYRQYSSEFPFASEVEERFCEVLEYLEELFPEPHMGGTRWYRKSDFYTLFLAVSRGVISSDDPVALRERLGEFARLVDSDRDASDGSPVGMYRLAVERAATDRTRRVRREAALAGFLAGIDPLDGVVDDRGDELSAVGEDADDEDELDEEYEDPAL